MRKDILGFLVASVVVLGTFAAPRAHAFFPGFPTDGNISGFTAANVTQLLQFGAIAADHRAYMPATPLGLSGFDLGVGATAFTVPATVKTLMTTISSGSGTQIPDLLVIPRVYFHKGLPFDADLELSGVYAPAGAGQNIYSIGGDLKWAFVTGLAVPSIAGRIGYTKSNAWYLDTSVISFDFSISKSLAIIDPYVGAGARYWFGSLNVPIGGGTGLSVSQTASGVAPRIFGGLALKLGFLRLVGDFEYNTIGMTTFGGKVSFGI